jgi:hypothetical protein
MKTTVKNLKPGDVFSTNENVIVKREGQEREHYVSGDQVSPLAVKICEPTTGYIKCKIKNIIWKNAKGDLWVFVPLDAKCEVK